MGTARYKAVVDRIASEIRSGRLPTGTRLPTHRQLAAREGIALATSTRVYAELEAMGLVSGEQGRGTFVRELALPPGHGDNQQALAADIVDLSFNYPSVPGQADMLRQALRQLASSGDLDTLLRYQPHRGRPTERATVARYLRQRGLSVAADQVLIVNGAQHGLATTVMATLAPGDVVAADALTYPGFKVLAQSLRLEVAPLPVTVDGPDLDALEQLCTVRPVRAVYAMPTMHNPLGWVMSAPARARLVDIARRHQLLIIEDGSYAYLAETAPEPLAALAPENTVYVSGISKSIATGLRVGFLCAPVSLVTALERAIRATTWNTAAITTAIVCGWLEDGTVGRLETSKREDARRRQAIVDDALTGLSYRSHPSSYFVWVPLPGEARAERVAARLMRERISVSTAEPYAMSPHVPQAIRLALGSTDLDSLRASLATVRRVIDEDPYG
ncbi:aminotransferase-like domain-containing protein [Mycolicibacterium mengxianglii]|uniref:aminotransferase-like domain-containing protein n=1 Tax=Mycolicibacterium mengxianglii TaxID=2736649 RepID=UPI0018EF014E|nr:PLP-dependent aminotransferase family protein [Mycolicibacterium mengxianglii]